MVARPSRNDPLQTGQRCRQLNHPSSSPICARPSKHAKSVPHVLQRGSIAIRKGYDRFDVHPDARVRFAIRTVSTAGCRRGARDADHQGMFGHRVVFVPVLCVALGGPFACSTAASAAPQERGPRLERLLDRVNQVRARGCRCGTRWMPPAGPLRWNRRLARAAERHAEAMAAGKWFSHVGPGGSTLTSRARDAGYTGFAGARTSRPGNPRWRRSWPPGSPALATART